MGQGQRRAVARGANEGGVMRLGQGAKEFFSGGGGEIRSAFQISTAL